jgi:hypothetical protein
MCALDDRVDGDCCKYCVSNAIGKICNCMNRDVECRNSEMSSILSASP